MWSTIISNPRLILTVVKVMLRSRANKKVVIFLFLLLFMSVFLTYKVLHVSEKMPEIVNLYDERIQASKDVEMESFELFEESTAVLETRTKTFDTEHSEAVNPGIKTALLDKLLELESDLVSGRKRVVLKGLPQIVEINAPIFMDAFNLLGYKADIYDNQQEAQTQDWKAMICLTWNDGYASTCLDKYQYSSLKAHQKISRIPGVWNILWRRNGFCFTAQAALHVTAISSTPVASRCFVLPAQAKSLSKHLESSSPSKKWVVKSLSPGGFSHFITSKELKTSKGAKLLKTETVFQTYPDNPLLIFKESFTVLVYVFVTSISPLRVYRHKQGIVKFHGGKLWKLSQFEGWLNQNYGTTITRKTFVKIDLVIGETLLLAESSLLTHIGVTTNKQKSEQYRCQHCFQLMGFELIFNSSLYPVVSEVIGQPLWQEISSIKPSDEVKLLWSQVKTAIINDSVQLMFGDSQGTQEVLQALLQFYHQKGVQGVNCPSSNKLCIRPQELLYLIEERRESQNLGEFHKIYPSTSSRQFDKLLKALDTSDPSMLMSESTPSVRSTPQFHDILLALQTIYKNIKEQKNPNFKINQESMDTITKEDENSKYCSKDPGDRPFLSSLWIDPVFPMVPSFSNMTLVYTVYVPFEQMMVHVKAQSLGCNTEVRLYTKIGPKIPADQALGLGWTGVSIIVLDLTHTDPWVINTYVIWVYRDSLDNQTQLNAQNACGLIQDCNLKVLPDESCGLQSSNMSWNLFLDKYSQKPQCDASHYQGRWVVPCKSCASASSCQWTRAIWTPYDCKLRTLEQSHVKTCLAGKKVLFIGDSTNRGIMYHVLEQVNGTLMKWDKTHTMKIYKDNVNGNRTSVGFAYYPQFWLPSRKRPYLDKALEQFIAKNLPLENNTNTVLVMGGVQWMTEEHVHTVNSLLNKFGLSGITVIIKTLGSGFHLHLKGLHQLQEKDYRHLIERNSAIIEATRSCGFHAVDTFMMTVARYKEFYQGACACHFHKVIDLKSQKRNQYNDSPFSNPDSRYHVLGPVNFLYSDMVLDRMCSSSVR